MQTIWGRAAQARSSCRCPSCSFAHRSVPRRRTTASIAQNMCSSTTGFAVSFSTAVVSASYLDARSKQKRRKELDQSISDVRAEVRAIIESQEARLRALEERYVQNGERIIAQGGKEQAPEKSSTFSAFEPELEMLRRLHSQSEGIATAITSKPSDEKSPQLQTQPNIPGPPHQDLLDVCKRTLAARPPGQRRTNGPDADPYAHDSSRTDTALWESWPDGLPDARQSLILMVNMSRLIHRFDVLQLYLCSRPKKSRRREEVAESECVELVTHAEQSLRSLLHLEGVAAHLRASLRERLGAEVLDERIRESYRDLTADKAVKVCYKSLQSRGRQLAEVEKQEDHLLKLLQSRCDPADLLKRLGEFLAGNEFAPNIHMLNMMIIRLCERGLPCAARLVLDCVRASPLSATAVTDEAALRCALLERDEPFFQAYYGSMRGENRMGWHLPDAERHRAQLQLRRNVDRAMFGSNPVTQTMSLNTTHGGAEAVIRSYLRNRRIRPALREYLHFLQSGRIPSMQLMESLLRASLAVHDADMGWQLWQQLCFIYEKPSSAAYYWILNLLAAPGKEDNASPAAVAMVQANAAKFKQVAADLVYFYKVPKEPRYENFRLLGTGRRNLYRLSDEIEDFGVRQWVPGMSHDPLSLPDLLQVETNMPPSRRTPLTNLAHYVARQREFMDGHLEFDGEVHTTLMMQKFLRGLPFSSEDLAAGYLRWYARKKNLMEEPTVVKSENQKDTLPLADAVGVAVPTYPAVAYRAEGDWVERPLENVATA